ncbi:hypothetical protein BGZ68_005574 [Mortierella alpina]|nr:hypothetical protein BGZ68_005574 [Mortierella alpina]
METIQTLFDVHYSFRDSALTPDLGSPFSSPPVDIMKELKSITTKSFGDDFSFHAAISITLATLHDGHVVYNPYCYSSYTFRQNLCLYAPVINGKQSIRIYEDSLNRDFKDCVVQKINGQDAFPYIRNWSNGISTSKDAGVRLNYALASQQYDAKKKIVTKAGAFAERNTLPETPFTDYELQCESSSETIKLRETWNVSRNVKARVHFKNVTEYVTKVCLQPVPDEAVSRKQEQDLDRTESSLLPTVKNTALSGQVQAPSTDDDESDDDESEFEGAEKIASYDASIFYHLKAYPKVGVVVVPAHTTGDEEAAAVDNLVHGLMELHKRDVSNVIIDFQGNGGGNIIYAYWLVKAFFPSKDHFDIALPTDLRAPKIVQELAVACFQEDQGAVFDASMYTDFKTMAPYNSSDMFTHPVEKTPNGRTEMYSQTAIRTTPRMKDYKELEMFPWTNKPGNIHILTDGRCGSACGLSAHMLSAIKNVSATAIGGVQGQPLSKFSFVGGIKSDIRRILHLYEQNKVKTSLKLPPYDADLNFPVTETFAQGSAIPLEYDPAHHRANMRMDFDPKNARDRAIMWGQVAAQAWKQ